MLGRNYGNVGRHTDGFDAVHGWYVIVGKNLEGIMQVSQEVLSDTWLRDRKRER